MKIPFNILREIQELDQEEINTNNTSSDNSNKNIWAKNKNRKESTNNELEKLASLSIVGSSSILSISKVE